MDSRNLKIMMNLFKNSPIRKILSAKKDKKLNGVGFDGPIIIDDPLAIPDMDEDQ